MLLLGLGTKTIWLGKDCVWLKIPGFVTTNMAGNCPEVLIKLSSGDMTYVNVSVVCGNSTCQHFMDKLCVTYSYVLILLHWSTLTREEDMAEITYSKVQHVRIWPPVE